MINWIFKLFSRKEFTYHDNEYVKTTKSFFRNIPHGVWKYYNHEGIIERKLFYRKGNLIAEHFFTHDGRLYQKKRYSTAKRPARIENITRALNDYLKTLSVETIIDYVSNNAANKVVVLEALKIVHDYK